MNQESATSHTPLSSLAPGERAIVRSCKGGEEIHCRLRELGLTRGTAVRVKRYAPFGDPIELIVRGYHLSLRRKDAESILVEKAASGS